MLELDATRLGSEDPYQRRFVERGSGRNVDVVRGFLGVVFASSTEWSTDAGDLIRQFRGFFADVRRGLEEGRPWNSFLGDVAWFGRAGWAPVCRTGSQQWFYPPRLTPAGMGAVHSFLGAALGYPRGGYSPDTVGLLIQLGVLLAMPSAVARELREELYLTAEERALPSYLRRL